MKITFKIDNGQIIPYSLDDKNALADLKNGVYQVDVRNMDMRTIKQNSAMHKYFSMLSDKLNEGGLSVAKTLKIDIEWTPTSVKDLLWRPIQEAVLDKKSTTKLTKDEITKVYDVLNRALAERFGMSVEFPSRDLD